MTTVASHPPIAPLPSAWSALPPEYAIPDHAPSEEEAREYCRRLARSHYENFSVASWFLPEHLRQHFFNVYAYCRISDDLGDEVGDSAASLQLLEQWENELNACYDPKNSPFGSDGPILWYRPPENWSIASERARIVESECAGTV